MAEERAPTPPEPAESSGSAGPADESDSQRRRRVAAVFGDVLPETTQDERDPEAAPDEDAQDRWLRSQVPPHHG